MDTPTTLLEAARYFSDLDRCEDYMRSLRWPTGTPRCPECDSTNIGEIKTLRLLRCRNCRRKIYIKRGTIFEDSPLGLDKWFVIIWVAANTPNIGSVRLGKLIGIQQKSAWRMIVAVHFAKELC